ncbi:hypothetical protein PAESOLCIP111_05941 [Paenibacillus solanacearum]|uniref:Uncharacterized protein n=1 Tax=Paenibacillus solanacearum TaxID=2048548 RepID=A0A916NYT0_9BACL|nr:hypothetical protein PAESOLCIP111_05941 [Paenibacillus solanacearum]
MCMKFGRPLRIETREEPTAAIAGIGSSWRPFRLRQIICFLRSYTPETVFRFFCKRPSAISAMMASSAAGIAPA